MKYLDQVCGLRLKTAVKIIAVFGMVGSMIGFAVAVGKMTAIRNRTTDAQIQTGVNDEVTSEEFMSSEEESATNYTDVEETTITPSPDVFVTVGNNLIEDDIVTEGQEVGSSMSDDAVARAKREVSTTTDEPKLNAGTDPAVNLPAPPSEDGDIDYYTDTSEASSPDPETGAPTTTLATTASTTTSSTTKETREETTTSMKHIENDDASDVNKDNLVSYEDDYTHDGDHKDDMEEATEETGTESTTDEADAEIHSPVATTTEDVSPDEVAGETAGDEDDSTPSPASQIVTGMGAPICLMGFMANAVLLHSAKKAEKKLLYFWMFWAVVLYLYQVVVVIVNIADFSPYAFLNLFLFISSVVTGYVVMSYRKQLSDPSSYSLKTVEMNGYSLDKGYMELDNKGSTGSSADGDNKV